MTGTTAYFCAVALLVDALLLRLSIVDDLGQVTANIMLAAADLGIGSGHSAVRDQAQAQRVLGFPDGYFAAFMVGLGYPADRPLRPLRRPNRRSLDEVVHWDHW